MGIVDAVRAEGNRNVQPRCGVPFVVDAYFTREQQPWSADKRRRALENIQPSPAYGL